ncbi:hypothetical protein BZG36_00809 [Bifiguratus adelaidae]|uniref:histone deacetylase n=1 Tax=Bifiguratus adelaidae TaxID=1938954 RepID=A0A261Y6R7_9FUNG|nr:hypothetical protein BZG36_00809 [Bifiguratus adelaidae]
MDIRSLLSSPEDNAITTQTQWTSPKYTDLPTAGQRWSDAASSAQSTLLKASGEFQPQVNKASDLSSPISSAYQNEEGRRKGSQLAISFLLNPEEQVEAPQYLSQGSSTQGSQSTHEDSTHDAYLRVSDTRNGEGQAKTTYNENAKGRKKGPAHLDHTSLPALPRKDGSLALRGAMFMNPIDSMHESDTGSSTGSGRKRRRAAQSQLQHPASRKRRSPRSKEAAEWRHDTHLNSCGSNMGPSSGESSLSGLSPESGTWNPDEYDSVAEEMKYSERGISNMDLGSPLRQGVQFRTTSSNPLCLEDLPFQIGEQVECIKPHERGTWFAARIVDVCFPKDEPTLSEPLVFVHFEGWPVSHAQWVRLSTIRITDNKFHPFLRYGPSGMEDAQSWANYGMFYQSAQGELVRISTGIVFDRGMLLHQCPCECKEFKHPERPERLTSILNGMHEKKLLRLVKRIQPREATLKELLKVHTEEHVRNYSCPVSSKDNGLQAMKGELQCKNCGVTRAIGELAAEGEVIKHMDSPTAMDENEGHSAADKSNEASRQTLMRPRRASTLDYALINKQRLEAGGASMGEEIASTEDVHMEPKDVIDHALKLVKVEVDKQENHEQYLLRNGHADNQSLATYHCPAQFGEPVLPPTLSSKMVCGEFGIAVDTTFHPLYTPTSARLAAGCVLNLVDAVMTKKVRNGFALVRPPGHHAEDDAVMGFCFYNNVAIATEHALKKYADQVKRVLILDWDIHHGNGTQKAFYSSADVLYISIHRWDNGTFYPFSGSPEESGEGEGEGFNVNIALSGDHPGRAIESMGDTEFMAAMRHIVSPIARQFKPDLVLVSAGFDAALGSPQNLGGYKVTPDGFAMMTRIIKSLSEELCEGRLVMCLEGGYDIPSLTTSALSTIQALLPSELSHEPTDVPILPTTKPNVACTASLQQVIDVHKEYWNFQPDEADEDAEEAADGTPLRFALPRAWRITAGVTTRSRKAKDNVTLKSVPGY